MTLDFLVFYLDIASIFTMWIIMWRVGFRQAGRQAGSFARISFLCYIVISLLCIDSACYGAVSVHC